MQLRSRTLVRSVFGFINLRTLVRTGMWTLRRRRARTFLLFEGRAYTYREVYVQARRYARFFLAERRALVDAGKLDAHDRLAVALYMDNVPEYVFAVLGAGLSNSVVFAVNTGFRGRNLATVLAEAKVTHLIVNTATSGEAQHALTDGAFALHPDYLFYVGDPADAGALGWRPIEPALDTAPDVPRRDRVPIDNLSPVLVFYTSGTTGSPKGVPCTHAKVVGAAVVVWRTVHLRSDDRGYVCTPLCHSNAWFIGILPQLLAGGSFVLKRRFSARAFEDDVLEHGVTFMNYVGQPIHYIVDALEKRHGSGEAVERALAHDPRNHFRAAYGNGASVVDRRKLRRYLGMEHVYEIYGSTEAVIATANRPGDPIESVGRIDESVCILDERDRECAPAVVDAAGKLLNYEQAVGEICRRVGADNLRFDGYHGKADATARAFRGGVYHSGDLGHVRVVHGKRYLYFDGRTDDWIRKDGENFSSEAVLGYAQRIPGVEHAIAYGAPSDVSDEKVMIAVQLREGAEFDPAAVHAWLEHEQREGGMDPKWMPDFIRVEDQFPMTETGKIPVRPYKKEHFDLERTPGMRVYHRPRGATTYVPLTPEACAAMKESFRRNGREALLGP
jgi:fatty-acyl-CoA synthase